ncbi:MAG: Zinc ribbon domain protein [Chloroflexi bacterium ADurb.Bin120]|uniref:FmdB family zinc ribbon protein n=1 Tax=Candidatus Brevifilum fermentans TaxID=1986204 RepID=UPI0009C9770C|nr:zinc ribbon domain-containing protein [Chloroflexota bacterium]OQB86774.1 MAG: Zinc ribbon domain protein [Chloroflexi bacterium ADurb.Bin120]
MPLYAYHCDNCDQDFEKLVRFSDPNSNTPECPGCQSRKTRKRLSTIAAISSGQSQSAGGCVSSGPFR